MTDGLVYVTFPKVTLLNATDKRMTEFMLFFRNTQTAQIHAIRISRTSVLPHQDYIIESNKWVTPDKLVQLTSDGKTANIRKQQGLDSQKMWLQGTAGAFVLEVVEATFEDGSIWDGSKWLEQEITSRLQKTQAQLQMNSGTAYRTAARSLVLTAGATLA
jgi:hypothetical protein